MLLINGNQTPSTPEGVIVKIQGELILAGNPTEPLEAAAKQYVDSKFNSLDASRLIEGTVLAARLPAFSGDVVSENGSNILSLADTGVNSGTYTKVTVDSKGRVTGGATLTESDIPSLNWSKITSGVPTTLAGYGIIDGLSVYGGTISSNLTVTGEANDNRDAVTKGYVDGFQITGMVETGVVMKRAVSSAVTGYLRANGADVSKTTYSDLYNVIGDAFIPIDFSTNEGQRIGSGKPWKLQWDINDTSGNMGSWTTETNRLPESLIASQAVVTNSRVYLLGGNNGNATNKVYSAPVNSDGTIGTWSTESITLPEPLHDSQVITTSSRVYLLGGINSDGGTNKIYSAPINSDSTIGTWSTESITLPGTLFYSQAVITSSRVYLLGGDNGSSVINTIYSAPVNTDGTLGTWVTEGNTLPDALSLSQAVVTSSKVYLLGGQGNSERTNKIYSAPVNTDGTLGTWVTEANTLPNPVAVSQAVVTSNKVYLLGGNGGSGRTRYMQSASIDSNGTIGNWTSTDTGLIEQVDHCQAFVTSSRIYLAGCYGETSPIDKVYSAPFTGGLNDYIPIITAPIGSTSITGTYPDDKFRLPDYSSREQSGKYFFIKY